MSGPEPQQAAAAPVPAPSQRLLSFDVGVRHLAFADVEVWGEGETEVGVRRCKLHRWEVLDVAQGSATPVARMGIEALTEALVEALDAHLFDPDVRYDVVLVENQPACKNPLMKSVQMVLYSYFVVLRRYVGNVGAVRLVNATRKLTLRHAPEAAGAPDAPEVAGAAGAARSAGDAYRERKAAAVRIAGHYLREVLRDEGAQAQLAASRKKDDLCDCLLQALWFVEQEQERRAKEAAKEAAQAARAAKVSQAAARPRSLGGRGA